MIFRTVFLASLGALAAAQAGVDTTTDLGVPGTETLVTVSNPPRKVDSCTKDALAVNIGHRPARYGY